MSALEEVRDLAASVVTRRSLRLWDVEMSGRPGSAVVRVFIDAPGGVDLDTVAEVSEEISRGLDLRDPIEGRYTLEVSSPGLERNLRTKEHFDLSVGSLASVKAKEHVGETGSHRIDGRISKTTDSSVVIVTDRGEVEVPFEIIRSARTVFEWERGSKDPRKRSGSVAADAGTGGTR